MYVKTSKTVFSNFSLDFFLEKIDRLCREFLNLLKIHESSFRLGAVLRDIILRQVVESFTRVDRSYYANILENG